MRPVTLFIAGGLAGAVARPYLQRAARGLLVSAIESVEKTQLELEHVEKLKAEADAQRAAAETAMEAAERMREEAEQLRDEALRGAVKDAPAPEFPTGYEG